MDDGRVERRLEVLSDRATQGFGQHFAFAHGGREVNTHSLRSMAEEHVVGMFLVHMLSLIATVIPFNRPREARAGSSGTTYTSAFTLAFLTLTACRHDTCVAVAESKQDENL